MKTLSKSHGRLCKNTWHASILFMGLALLSPSAFAQAKSEPGGGRAPPPVPLLAHEHPVDWWLVFKLNAASFPECGQDRACPFGGKVQDYHGRSGQQFVYASSEHPALQKGTGCVGTTDADPVGATFGHVYKNSYHYVVWNDQLYDAPKIKGCSKSCGAPWGHSKGMLAWNDAGEGLVMQVSTPSWPASGSSRYPRKNDGNTLGCILDDDVEVSQHFFALRLKGDDLIKVLKALKNASVVTDPRNKQLVQNGGPPEVQALVKGLGHESKNKTVTHVKLSSGVELISKPSGLHVPPWQLVSSELDAVPLRAATWWAPPKIYTTGDAKKPACWDKQLGSPGPVEIATSGEWDGRRFNLTGGSDPDRNHAKIGVSTLPGKAYSIFGDMNQQGALSPGYAHAGQKCSSSQNGRGGLFYVLQDPTLFASVSALIKGDSAPPAPPAK